MTTKIFFDNPWDAEKISFNIEEPINEDELSIIVDPDELNKYLSIFCSYNF